MKPGHTQGTWKAILEEKTWKICSSEKGVIASVEKGGQDEANAKLIAASPLMLEALLRPVWHIHVFTPRILLGFWCQSANLALIGVNWCQKVSLKRHRGFIFIEQHTILF